MELMTPEAPWCLAMVFGVILTYFDSAPAFLIGKSWEIRVSLTYFDQVLELRGS